MKTTWDEKQAEIARLTKDDPEAALRWVLTPPFRVRCTSGGLFGSGAFESTVTLELAADGSVTWVDYYDGMLNWPKEVPMELRTQHPTLAATSTTEDDAQFGD